MVSAALRTSALTAPSGLAGESVVCSPIVISSGCPWFVGSFLSYLSCRREQGRASALFSLIRAVGCFGLARVNPALFSLISPGVVTPMVAFSFKTPFIFRATQWQPRATSSFIEKKSLLKHKGGRRAPSTKVAQCNPTSKERKVVILARTSWLHFGCLWLCGVAIQPCSP